MDNTDETASAAKLGDTAEGRGTPVTKGQKRSLASAGKKERQSKKARGGGGSALSAGKGMEDVDEPDDDEGDPNDITALAGIDVEGEEEQMTEEVEVDEFVITELEEDLYLNYECLKAKAAAIAKKNGMKQVKGEALMLLSLAIQWRLRQMLEKMIISSQHRRDVYKRHCRSINEDTTVPDQLAVLARTGAVGAGDATQAEGDAEAGAMAIDGAGTHPPDHTENQPSVPAEGSSAQGGGEAGNTKTIEVQDCIMYLEGDKELGRTPLLYKTYSLLT